LKTKRVEKRDLKKREHSGSKVEDEPLEGVKFLIKLFVDSNGISIRCIEVPWCKLILDKY